MASALSGHAVRRSCKCTVIGSSTGRPLFDTFRRRGSKITVDLAGSNEYYRGDAGVLRRARSRSFGVFGVGMPQWASNAMCTPNAALPETHGAKTANFPNPQNLSSRRRPSRGRSPIRRRQGTPWRDNARILIFLSPEPMPTTSGWGMPRRKRISGASRKFYF